MTRLGHRHCHDRCRVATDLAGNNNAASTSTDNSVTWDNVAPTVTINQAAGQADPTNGATINFTVVFSEAVTGFTTGDVTLGGTAGGTLTGTVTGGPTTYNVAVTGMTGPGTVVATIAAGVATDPAGNRNAASTSTDNSVTWDNVAPVAHHRPAGGIRYRRVELGQPDQRHDPGLRRHLQRVRDRPDAADFSNVGTSTGCGFGTITGSAAAWTVTATRLLRRAP